MRDPNAPEAPEQRLVLVDALRGLALLGILVVNMGQFSHTSPLMSFGNVDPPSGIDRWVAEATSIFAEGKFYSIFSLLFGLGLFLQMSRSDEAGTPFVGHWTRRLLILLGFGIAHGILVWDGDILAQYALLGLPLLWWRRASNRALVGWALAFIGFSALFWAGMGSLLRLPEVAGNLAEAVPEMQAELDKAFRLYQQGSYAAVVAYRTGEITSTILGLLLVVGLPILAMFLLGLWTGRRGLLREPGVHRALLGRLLVAGLLVGIPATTLLVRSYRSIHATPGIVPEDVAAMLQAIGAMILAGPALAAVYLSGAALAWGRPGPRRCLTAVAPVGRMALTNYLLQSIVCTTLFYGYGFGLLGKVGITGAFGLALVIYVLQVLASRWWLARYRFGPAEWLWRSLTYGTRQPMSRPAHPVAPSMG